MIVITPSNRPPSAVLAKGGLLFALPVLSPVVAFLALDHGRVACVFIEDACPLADALQDRDDRLPLLRQRVFHPRRDLVVGLALDQAVGDEELEGRSQDCVRLARLLRSSYRRNSASGRYGSVYESLYYFRVAED